jgi:hypothetical protein
MGWLAVGHRGSRKARKSLCPAATIGDKKKIEANRGKQRAAAGGHRTINDG